jgi:hypothetical protein
MVSLEWTSAYPEKVFRLNPGGASSLLSHRREPVKLTAYPPDFRGGAGLRFLMPSGNYKYIICNNRVAPADVTGMMGAPGLPAHIFSDGCGHPGLSRASRSQDPGGRSGGNLRSSVSGETFMLWCCPTAGMFEQIGALEILTSEKKLPGSMGERPGGAAAPAQLRGGFNRSARD